MRAALLTAIAAFACATAARAADVDLAKPPPQVPVRKPVALGEARSELVVQFTNWTSALAINDLVGELRRGLFCGDPTKLSYTKKLDEWFSGNLSRSFKDRTLKLGFSAPERAKSVFDDKPGSSNSADLRVGATLLAFDYRTCGLEEVKGHAYAKIKWEVFSARQQRVVYSAIVESSLARDDRLASAEFTRAFMDAIVDGLLADTNFAELVRTGATAAGPVAVPAPLKLDIGQVVEGGVAKAAPGLLEAVVTVESGVGSGSAFYISQEGYLLTNQHVVADAKFVRVKLPGGRSLVSGTLTHGVLSQRRVVEGVAYLQSDVAVNPGNSGGPLIDAEGRVLGITQMGLKGQGINLFIPIEDALDKLGLVLKGGQPAAK